MRCASIRASKTLFRKYFGSSFGWHGLMNFFSELKRRNVYRVAITYAVVAWLLVQVGSILFPTFEVPAWVMKAFVTAIAVGFPISLVMAWAFELTPQGIKRTEAVDVAQKQSPRGG